MTRTLPLQLQPHPITPHGHALLDLNQVLSDATSSVELTIQAPGGEYLQPQPDTPQADAVWREDNTHKLLLPLYGHDQGALYELGPTIIDPLLESGLIAFALQVYQPGESTPVYEGHLVCKDLMHSSAFDASVAVEKPVVAPAPAKPVPPVSPEPAPEPINELPPSKAAPAINDSPKKGSASKTLILILVALVLMAALAAALFFWWKNKAEPAPEPTPEPAPVELSVAACDLAQLDQKTETEFLQTCLQSNLDSPALLDVIQTAIQAEKCSVAQRLYANRSQAGDTLIASAYAKEYDPKYHTPSACFSEPNAITAVYWYDTILLNDPTNTEAQQRLEELKQ